MCPHPERPPMEPSFKWEKREQTWGLTSNVPWSIIEGDEGKVRYIDSYSAQYQGTTVEYWVKVPNEEPNATVEIGGFEF